MKYFSFSPIKTGKRLREDFFCYLSNRKWFDHLWKWKEYLFLVNCLRKLSNGTNLGGVCLTTARFEGLHHHNRKIFLSRCLLPFYHCQITKNPLPSIPTMPREPPLEKSVSSDMRIFFSADSFFLANSANNLGLEMLWGLLYGLSSFQSN